jgi:hypothetical protein
MNLTANGNTNIVTDPGREYAFSVSGSFGGGTLTLQWGSDGVYTSFTDSAGAVALTAAGARVVVAPSRIVRFALAGATSPTINVDFVPTIK